MPSFPLPEDCTASILSLTSPKDACVASAVSSLFKSAAESDAVWERFLPSDYREIIARSPSPDYRLNRHCSLKELYLKLCDTPILFEEGRLSLRLIKPTGKKCYMLSASNLMILQDHPNSWVWTSSPESRFGEVAQLNSCWLLDVFGTLRASMLSPDTYYTGHLIFKLAERNFGLGERSEGSVNYVHDADVMAWNEAIASKIVRIEGPQIARRGRNPLRTNVVWNWDEIELGGIFVGRNEGRRIRCRLSEMDSLTWKSGLIVDGIELRPA